jgi:hypothetical protein
MRYFSPRMPVERFAFQLCTLTYLVYICIQVQSVLSLTPSARCPYFNLCPYILRHNSPFYPVRLGLHNSPHIYFFVCLIALQIFICSRCSTSLVLIRRQINTLYYPITKVFAAGLHTAKAPTFAKFAHGKFLDNTYFCDCNYCRLTKYLKTSSAVK